MRSLFPLLPCLTVAIAGQAPKRPPIQLQNVSHREVVITPLIRRGNLDVAVGKAVRLAPKSGLVAKPKLFGVVQPASRYALKFSDPKGKKLGLVRIDGRMLQSGMKSGLILAVHDASVSLRLGSRRQRVLLIP